LRKRYETVFLDRDGVINRMRSNYVKKWKEIEFLPGAIDALVRISGTGRQIFVVTNQSVIAKNLVSAATVDAIHMRISSLVAQRGGVIRAFLVCPHCERDSCDCRKPAPGLFFRARDEMGVRLGDAVMVGDQIWDVQAARAAGVNAIVAIGSGSQAALLERSGCVVVPSLVEAAELICAYDR
jgi:D-glycero-D-manno-heptose 1,7-bisphosphate phosphatase